jgi:hypothetical protein
LAADGERCEIRKNKRAEIGGAFVFPDLTSFSPREARPSQPARVAAGVFCVFCVFCVLGFLRGAVNAILGRPAVRSDSDLHDEISRANESIGSNMVKGQR